MPPSFHRLRSAPCSTRPLPNSIHRPGKPSSSNLLLYFSSTGILGLTTYVLGGSPASFSTLPGAHYEAKAREVRTGPGTFPRPKAVELYKHNISRFVSESPDGGGAVSLVIMRTSRGGWDNRRYKVEYGVYIGRCSALQSPFPLLELGTFDNVYPVYMPGTDGAGMSMMQHS
ncbi:hypothetical protein V8E53_012134 [Lactarius tabidus]